MAIKVTVGQTTFIKKIVVGTPVATAQTGISIDDFSDFSVATKSDGQILVYDSAENAFKNFDFNVGNALAKEFTPGTDKLLIQIDSDKTPVVTGIQTKGNIVPTLDSTFDLGDSAKKFKDLYLSGGTIHLGGIDIKDSGGTLGAKDSSGSPVNIDLQGSIAQIRRMFTSGGDLTYDTGTGVFQFDVEQVYTKENFDSDFNITLDSAVLEGVGLNYSNATNTLNIDSGELESFFKQDIRGYFSAGGDLSYNSSTGQFSFDVEQVYTRANFESDLGEAVDGGVGIAFDSATDTIRIDSSELSSFFRQDIRGYISATDAGGDGSFAYNNTTGVFTYTGPSPAEVRAHFSATDAGGDGAFAYNSSTGVFTYTGPSAAEVRAHLAAVDAGGDGSFSYDSSTGAYTYTGPSATEVRAHMAVVDAGGDGSLTYDSSTGAYTYTGPSASEVRSHFSAQGDLSYDSSTGVFQFDVEQVYTKANFDSDFNVAMDSGTTNDLAEGSNNLYYTVARSDSDFDKNLDSASTDKLSEGSNNLYYTVARSDSDFDKNLDSASTDKLSEGSNNLYYTVARSDSDFDKNLDSASTDKLSEGSNNLYYTVARADSAAKAALLGGTGVTYDSSTGVIAIGQPVATTDNVTFNQVRGPAEFIIDPATVGDNTGTVKILGNLQVEGTQTVINSTAVSINDKNIVLADSAADAAAADGAGITINGASATLTYSASGDKFVFNKSFEGQYLGFDSDFDSALTTKTTTNLAEGNNLYYTVARSDSDFDKNLDSASTDKLSEGSTNLYYTVARSDSDFDKNLDSASTDKLSEGTSNLYYTKARSDSDFDMNLDSASTDKLSEGSTNLYYTVARADSAAKAALFAVDAGGDGSFTYDSSSGVMTYTGPSASEVRAHFTANKGLSVTSGEFNIDSSNVKGMFTGDKGLAYNSSTGTFDIDSANVRGMFSASGDLSYNSGTGQFSIDVESVYTSDNFDSDYFFAKDSANAAVERNKHDSTTKNFAVTVASKVAHVYQGQGSSQAYYIDGTESPIVNLKLGRTYRFTLSSSDMSSHPFRFYYDAAKNTQYTTGVTTAATYAEITITEATPPVLHYQCSSHGYMGHALQIGTRNFTGFTTTDLGEGTNLYFLNSRARQAISLGSAGSRAYNNSTGQITIPGTTDHITEGSNLFYTDARVQAVSLDSAEAQDIIDSNFANDITFGGVLTGDSATFGGITLSVVGGQSTIQKDGALNIRGNWIRLQKPNTATDMIVAKPDGEVELYHAGSQKLETTAYGATITGLLSADSAVFSDRIKSRTGYFSTNNEDSSSFATVVIGERPFNDGLASLEFRNQSNTFSSKIDGGANYFGVWTNKNSVSDYRIIANFGTADETIILKPLGTDRLTVNKYGAVVNGTITADSATISGLSFPTSDGLNNQVLRTDGAGNLSFASVTALSGNLDSSQVIDLVDSAYVQARTAAGTDSAATQAMIDSSITFQVDSAYIAARTTAGTDSAAIINLIDSAYVQARASTQTTGTINNVKNDAFTGNASTTEFGLSVTPADSDDVLVFVNGVLQHTTSYSLSGSTITLDSAPDSSSTIDIRTHLIQSQNLSLRDFQNYIYTLSSTLDSVSGADSGGNTLTYDADKVDVYVNGARLVNGKDYTAGNGTQIVFDSALHAGNIIEVVSHSKATVLDPELTSVDVSLDSAGANQAIYSFSKSAFRTFKFTAQLSHSSSNNYHTEEVLLIHNGTSVAMTTYGQILLDSNLGTFDATISGSNVQLKLSPTKTNVGIKLRGVRTPV